MHILKNKSNFVLFRCEEETSEKEFSPVRDLLGLIASFTLLGKTELKVALCVSNPQPPGFKFDPPLTAGTDAPQNTPHTTNHLLLLLTERQRQLCPTWWSRTLLTNLLKMPHIHSPPPYHSPPFITKQSTSLQWEGNVALFVAWFHLALM